MNGFIAPIQLRWTDLDAQGHVNNVVVADYLQQARAVFLKSGPAGDLLDSGCVVVGHQIAYLAPIAWSDEPLRVELVVAELGIARFEIAYRLISQGELCAEARTVLCPFDFEQRSPARLGKVARDYLAGYRGQAAELRELSAPALDGRGHVHEFYTRWSDPDLYRHVNNVRYLDYVLAGRVAMTTAADPSMARVGTGNPEAVRWLVARQDIDYLVQMEFRLTPYAVLTAPVRLGESSMVLASEIVDPQAGTVFARARCVLVCADAAGHKQPLPDAARRALAELLVTG